MSYIAQHHLIRKEGIRDFLSTHYKGELPVFEKAAGTVRAEINHGRWIVECPNNCKSALMVDVTEPYFFCVNCGSPENKGQWYTVLFPSDLKEIEAVLLKRPYNSSPSDAPNRNWKFGETLADLKRENAERGIV